jgi:hypothetical protein
MAKERTRSNENVRTGDERWKEDFPPSDEELEKVCRIFAIENSETRKGLTFTPTNRRWNTPNTAFSAAQLFKLHLRVFEHTVGRVCYDCVNRARLALLEPLATISLV